MAEQKENVNELISTLTSLPQEVIDTLSNNPGLLSMLGGLQPPAANYGTLLSENFIDWPSDDEDDPDFNPNSLDLSFLEGGMGGSSHERAVQERGGQERSDRGAPVGVRESLPPLPQQPQKVENAGSATPEVAFSTGTAPTRRNKRRDPTESLKRGRKRLYSDEEMAIRRKERNLLHAQASRMRKKEQFQHFEQRCQELTRQNQEYRYRMEDLERKLYELERTHMDTVNALCADCTLRVQEAQDDDHEHEDVLIDGDKDDESSEESEESEEESQEEEMDDQEEEPVRSSPGRSTGTAGDPNSMRHLKTLFELISSAASTPNRVG